MEPSNIPRIMFRRCVTRAEEAARAAREKFEVQCKSDLDGSSIRVVALPGGYAWAVLRFSPEEATYPRSEFAVFTDKIAAEEASSAYRLVTVAARTDASGIHVALSHGTAILPLDGSSHLAELSGELTTEASKLAQIKPRYSDVIADRSHENAMRESTDGSSALFARGT